MTGFGKIGLNDGSIYFEKILMAEMDRHQLALAYDAL